MAPTAGSNETVFPDLYCCTKLGDTQPLYDVKFYPWSTDKEDQIFAVCGTTDIFVCRLQLGSDPPYEILWWFKDPTRDHSYNTLVWTQDPISGKPLVCFAGANPKQVQFLDIESGERLKDRSLSGHGKGINDLAVSPLSNSLIASASEDYTLRLWNIEPKFSKQPCVALFAGEGHRQPILACSFHSKGRWMLSSGLDTAICLWAIPNLQDLDRDDYESHVNPKVVYYPHFHSTEIQDNYIDNVVFYGDLILSRSAKDQSDHTAENNIILWKVDGFNSSDDPPEEPPIPTSGICTRSSFPHTERSRGFQRLLTFDMPNTSRFYLRFGLLHQPDMRPILAMGSTNSKFHFWDLQKLEEGYDPSEQGMWAEKKQTKKAGPRRGRKKGVATAVNKSNLDRLSELRHEGSIDQSDATGGASGKSAAGGKSTASGTPETSTTSASAPLERKYDLSDSFRGLKPNRHIVAKTGLSDKHFATTQIAWSPDGCWMVAVGDHGMMCIFHRDKSVV